jgi:class 3 adenylate cyclase
MSTVPASERRQLTVMLCDLVGWTALSQRLDAEELAELVQAYRQRCTSIITSHGGAVAQYVGDAALAYFGYPRAHEDDAERAMRAALAIVEAARSAPDGADSSVHIGIATGMVVVGRLSRDDARCPPGGGDLSGDSISAVGSALNLAARLQALAGPGMIVVSDQTRRLAGAMFDYADLGLQHLKGFEAPVQAWQVVGEARVRSRFHALRASALTPLVDRRSELEALRQAWRSARGGEGKVLLLSSEPGVGKSRLAEVVATQIVDRRCLRLWYYCSPHLQSSPLAPLIRQLALAAGIAESDDQASKLQKLIDLIPKAVGDADDIVPLLADLLSIDYASRYPPLQMSPQRKKQRLFQGLMRVLESFASRHPVLLVVEDLHWIDPSSDELVGVLVDRLRGLPVLAILTARPEFEWHWHDTGQLLSMPLRPLERSDSIAMIELLCGGRHIPEVTITHIADQTDGLPLFIEDLTRDVLEELNQSGGGASVPRGRAASAVPTTLADALMARLDRLMPVKGWNLAGAFSLGGAQVALKSQGCAIGRQVAFMGTGALLYLVAAQYAKAGANVVAVLDTSSWRLRVAALPKLLARPSVLYNGVLLNAALRRAGVPIYTGIQPLQIKGSAQTGVSGLSFKDAHGQIRDIQCDAVAMGYHLRPETQLADLARCEFHFDREAQQWLPRLDIDGRSSVRGVYLAGEFSIEENH